MVLIDTGGHRLQQVEQPGLESGIWYLISFCELSHTNNPVILSAITFKNPIPVLLNLQKNILIYRFGKPAPKSVICVVCDDGTIHFPHPRNNQPLTGTYMRVGNLVRFDLRYKHSDECTVFIEFRKTLHVLPDEKDNVYD
ncbi:MAG: hypothetical protein MUC87_03490 [Bacteroidia bacterium]|nr:hypothetical protein [Bacteroidia bacterium]